jgi:hypothetical protein
MDPQLYRRLNSIDYTQIPDLAEFVLTHPEYNLDGDDLYFNHLLCPTAPEQQQNILRLIYNDKRRGLGHGINAFYEIVRHVAVIPRRICTEFLKAQIPYQMTRPIVAFTKHFCLLLCFGNLRKMGGLVFY